MYESHPLFPPLPAEARLWRYMDLTKFISLLDTGTLYFPRADCLPDAWEGAVSARNVALRPEIYKSAPFASDLQREQFLQLLPRMVESFRELTYISCWHHNEHESAAMWHLYTGSAQGIAIQSTFERLTTAFHRYTENPVLIGQVQYVDYSATLIPEGNTFGPYIHKRASFAYENEVRGIIQLSSAGPVGLSPQVDLEILMESVYVAPASPDWVVKVIESVMRRFGMDRHLQHSSLADGPLY